MVLHKCRLILIGETLQRPSYRFISPITGRHTDIPHKPLPLNPLDRASCKTLFKPLRGKRQQLKQRRHGRGKIKIYAAVLFA